MDDQVWPDSSPAPAAPAQIEVSLERDALDVLVAP
jgi:hypothetical protein